MSDVNVLTDWLRYWPYAVAVLIGVGCAVVDRRIIGHYVLGALLALVAAGGAIGMNVSPFTFQGGDYYMESLIAMVIGLAGLAGYAVGAITVCVCRPSQPGAVQ